MTAPPDQISLVVAGQSYTGWKEISITRGIDRCVSTFSMLTMDRPSGPIVAPFDPIQIYANTDLLLTGHVETVEIDLDRGRHDVRITGHSLTKDLTDCTPDIKPGQYAGFTVAAIARAICQLFNITAVIQSANANVVVENTNLQRSESAFRFLERLCNLAGVLTTDNPMGQLVLTVAGQARSATHLTQGGNLERLRGSFNVARRFSEYIVKGQAAIGYGNPFNLDGAGGTTGSTSGKVQTAMQAMAIDAGVPRYRPHVTLAESQLTPQQLQARANWQRQFAYGKSIIVHARLRGFRQDNGTLWQPNLMIPLTAPAIYADDDVLIAQVTYTLDATSNGHVTDLVLGPVEGYTPDPGSVKLKKQKKGKKGKAGAAGYNFDGAGGFP